MPHIVMYWDGVDPGSGDDHADIEILNSNEWIPIPDNACGFRLGMPNHVWTGAWHFAQFGGGAPFSHDGTTYESTGPSLDAIVARGPVHGCANQGIYDFQTPLADIGINGDAPVQNGAGSFVADFTDEADITWLDFSGMQIEKPDPPPPPEQPKLPREFFAHPPSLTRCFRDFDGKVHCDTEAAAGALGLTSGIVAASAGAPTLTVSGGGIVPRVRAISAPGASSPTQTDDGKAQVSCPAELVLTATFVRDPSFDEDPILDPATVEYRFRFTHGPFSTVFSTVVGDDAKSVFHAVPIPLPPPIGQNGGGSGVTPGADDLAVAEPPGDTVGPSPDPLVQNVTATPLPPNEHKGAVRVEVVNVFDGEVSSDWTAYHLVCVKAARRTLRRGIRGAVVSELQRRLNRWLRRRQATPLAVNGRFGARTEAAVRAFQRANDLAVDGIAGPRTWERLLAL